MLSHQRLLYTATFLVLATMAVRAQLPAYDWAISLGKCEPVTTMAEGPDGRIFLLGKFNGTLDLDVGPGEQLIASPNGEGVYVSAVGADGAMAWAIGIPGNYEMEPGQILANSDGSILVYGYFHGMAGSDPSTTDYDLTSGGYASKTFVAKYTGDGALIWSFVVGRSFPNAPGRMALAADGTLLIAQQAYGNEDLDPGPGSTMYAADQDGELILRSFAPDGTFLSAVRIGELDLKDLTVLPNGELMVAGAFALSTVVGAAPDTLTLTGEPDHMMVCILRLSAAGVLLDASTVDDLHWNTFLPQFGPDGSVVLTGTFFGTIDLDPGPDSLLFNGPGNFVMKLDPDGALAWGGSWSDGYGTWPTAPILDGYGDVYILCGLNGEVDVDPGPGVTMLSTPYYNSYAIKLDGTDGAFHYGFTFSKGDPHFLMGSSMYVTRTGSILMSGRFRNFCDLDPGPEEHILHTQEFPSAEVCLSKLDQDIGLSVGSSAKGDALLFPQPCTAELHVLHAATKGTYAILDMEGRVLRTGQLQPLQAMIPVSDLASGAYVLRVDEPSGPWSKRFVKVR